MPTKKNGSAGEGEGKGIFGPWKGGGGGRVLKSNVWEFRIRYGTDDKKSEVREVTVLDEDVTQEILLHKVTIDAEDWGPPEYVQCLRPGECPMCQRGGVDGQRLMPRNFAVLSVIDHTEETTAAGRPVVNRKKQVIMGKETFEFLSDHLGEKVGAKKWATIAGGRFRVSRAIRAKGYRCGDVWEPLTLVKNVGMNTWKDAEGTSVDPRPYGLDADARRRYYTKDVFAHLDKDAMASLLDEHSIRDMGGRGGDTPPTVAEAPKAPVRRRGEAVSY